MGREAPAAAAAKSGRALWPGGLAVPRRGTARPSSCCPAPCAPSPCRLFNRGATIDGAPPSLQLCVCCGSSITCASPCQTRSRPGGGAAHTRKHGTPSKRGWQTAAGAPPETNKSGARASRPVETKTISICGRAPGRRTWRSVAGACSRSDRDAGRPAEIHRLLPGTPWPSGTPPHCKRACTQTAWTALSVGGPDHLELR